MKKKHCIFDTIQHLCLVFDQDMITTEPVSRSIFVNGCPVTRLIAHENTIEKFTDFIKTVKFREGISFCCTQNFWYDNIVKNNIQWIYREKIQYIVKCCKQDLDCTSLHLTDLQDIVIDYLLKIPQETIEDSRVMFGKPFVGKSIYAPLLQAFNGVKYST